MNTKTLAYPVQNYCLVVGLKPSDFPRVTPIQACSRDYGFDFDEDEIGRELLAPLPASLSSQVIFEIEADEFEQVFQCFLS
jgi:hypothetical protein